MEQSTDILEKLSPQAQEYAAHNEDFQRLIAEANKQATAGAARDSAYPPRRVDLLGDKERASLIDDALGLVNKIREKVGVKPLKDMPIAKRGDSGACLLANAFDNHANVGGTASFDGLAWREAAKQVAAEDPQASYENGVLAHPLINKIVENFDNGRLDPYAQDVVPTHEGPKPTNEIWDEAQGAVGG